MIGGHFDPLHDGHLSYINQAANYGNFLLCVVASDEQARLKKGQVNIPEMARAETMRAILRGLGIRHQVVVNHFDQGNLLSVEALKWWRPDILCRGGDKHFEDMPQEERAVCQELGIRIVHARLEVDRHGLGMMLL
ncbi:hypothetical protein LCGC14_1877470 [marine sediment metagenome]|uniref:Cytidyltransferase-like domain-containing protein n=1 Tax=marine sediment metagenome TaxID=412755 RepID=A0A0F9IHA5_9ZZZZ